MSLVGIPTTFQAYLDGDGGDSGHVTHLGAFIVRGITPPPVVGYTAAVLQENAMVFTFILVREVFLANIMRCIVSHMQGGSLVAAFIGRQVRLLNSHSLLLFLQRTLNIWVLSKLLVSMLCKEVNLTWFKVGQKEWTHSLVAQCT